MPAKIIDGKNLADKLKLEIKAKIELYNIKPSLAILMVGDQPASAVYVRNKQKACEQVGINFTLHHFKEDVAENIILDLISQLNENSEINGILVQLPLPPHLSINKIINNISPYKDVDGFNIINVGKLALGMESFIPGTVIGCLKLIQTIEPNLAGKKLLMIGRSNIVGRPAAQIFLQQNCTVTHVHSYSKNLDLECAVSDIIISAVGKPNYIKAAWLKKGSIIIDVGINKIEKNGEFLIIGDVEFEEALKKVKAITPVPGGVGPMTIACLLENTLKAFIQQNNL